MKIIVRTKPSAKKETVERIAQPTFGFGDAKEEMVEYKVAVKEPPIDGRANEAVVKALAKYFGVAPSLIRLVSGASTKRKVFEIFI